MGNFLSTMIPNPTTVTDNNTVRTVTLSEYKAVAYTLAEAFATDDVAQYAIETPRRAHWTAQQKWSLHLAIMEAITYAHIMNGLVTTVGEGYGCVGLWMPPNTDIDSYYTLFRSGLWRLYYKLCREGRARMFSEFFPLLHDTKAEVLGARDPQSYYLVYLGTRSEYRGRGLAKRLVGNMLEEADREDRAVYLESSNVANVGLYRKMGFEVVKRIVLVRGVKSVEMDVMVREPVSTGTTASSPMPMDKKTATVEVRNENMLMEKSYDGLLPSVVKVALKQKSSGQLSCTVTSDTSVARI